MDRTLAVAFCVSLACHLVLLGFQVVDLRWLTPTKENALMDVIYEYQIAEEELRRLQRQLADLGEGPKLTDASGAPSTAPGLSNALSQIRIPERPIAALSALPPETSATRSAVVDLTNLVEAARGDPVLLSYFSAIREQIQRTANQQTWLTSEVDAQGLVYVAFVLAASGRVHSVTVLGDRSAPSRLLHDIALRIIKTANPFAPFPPSLGGESSKTVVVPLEFLRGR
ncbi:MAG: energy transducer TonB [Candidatus Omnitrophica bacterium]|nr:energy transducer TonB [Candidatus Omnitrophota bacterium]